MNYWEKRQKQLNQELEKDEKKLKKKLSSFYSAEYRKLEKEIAAYYSIYGEDKVIEYRKLMQNLDDADRERLIKRMQDFAQLYPEYADMLPIRESIYKLNRLEGLQMSILMQQLEIGAVDIKTVREHLVRQAVRNANQVAETMGYGKNFYSENSEIIRKIVNAKWYDGKDFSERIWGNIQKLARYLGRDIAAGFARGDSYSKLVLKLRQRFEKVSRNDAYPLIYTEGTFISNEARAVAFEQDTEEYVFRIQHYKARRSGWSDICDDLHEKRFKWGERKPGINFPPMHPWCHCTATPSVTDREKFVEDYEKRHGNGEGKKISDRLKVVKNVDYGMIKKIIIPEQLRRATGITPNMIENMQKGINIIENEYELNLKWVLVEDLGTSRLDIPYLCRYANNNGKHESIFVLNSGFDFTGFDEIVARAYAYGYFSGKSITDHIIHEMAHVMTGQHIEDAEEFETFLNTVEKEYVPGVSGYSDDAKDGFETIAEAFVKIRNGEEVPDKARRLVEIYIERWKKK